MRITANNLKAEYICDVKIGQDGAMFGGYMFCFDADGECRVNSIAARKQVASFRLDKADILTPHSNAVCFGTEYYAENDEFPLLYTNIYNSYAAASNRKEGVCCVYRIMHTPQGFSSKLVQIIKIGFVENRDLWKSREDGRDCRPYGNFVVDTDHNKYYAFVMRDKDNVTRFFEFDVPHFTDGTYNGIYDANVVTLTEKDIREQFDCDYAAFIQGACYFDGKIFSLEGFTVPPEKGDAFAAQPKLMVVDVMGRKQIASINLYKQGLSVEPELICCHENCLYYATADGKMYKLSFEE